MSVHGGAIQGIANMMIHPRETMNISALSVMSINHQVSCQSIQSGGPTDRHCQFL